MSPLLGTLEFGGPDLAPGHLRDVLERQVDAAPPGSRIDWATYYFRDRKLAEALIRASERAVHVRLVLEPEPRRPGTNDAVLAMLERHGLGGGLRLARSRRKGGHLHAKVYAFSDPDIAWIGSFNPSGDEPEDSAVIAAIGDQDRGDNLLIGITRPRLTTALRRFVHEEWAPSRVPFPLRMRSYLPIADGDSRLYVYPRAVRDAIERDVDALGRGNCLRGAISHMQLGSFSAALCRAASKGATVDLLVHDTERRVPGAVVEELRAHGASVTRVAHPDELPMHAKFVIIERAGRPAAWLGSYNFNNRSRRRNAEVLLRTENGATIQALDARFEAIASRAAG